MQGTARFTGEYPATLDGEGRIQLPLALRDEWNVRRDDSIDERHHEEGCRVAHLVVQLVQSSGTAWPLASSSSI